MAAAVQVALEPPRPVSPIDGTAASDSQDNSWYRHSGQTGDSSGRSASPRSSKRQSPLLQEGRITSLDPRRITPTLHANLVAEILALRRDLDSKNAFIDNIEGALNTTKLELDSSNTQLAKAVRESAKDRKIAEEAEQHLYKVTEDLVRERDDALTAGQDLRKRLNTLTAKSRRQEQEFEQWQRDYETRTSSWASERAKLEHKLRNTEGQLRQIVDEIEARKNAETQHRADTPASPTKFSVAGSPGRGSAFTSPDSAKHAAQHARNASILSANSDFSHFATPPRYPDKPRGPAKTLADELEFDDDDENNDDITSDVGAPRSQLSLNPQDIPSNIGAKHFMSFEDLKAIRELAPSPSIVSTSSVADNTTPASVIRFIRVGPAQVLVNGDNASQEDLVTAVELLRGRGVPRDGPPGLASSTLPQIISNDVLRTDAVPQLDFSTPPRQYASAGTQFDLEVDEVLPTTDRPTTPAHSPLSVPHIAIHPPSSAPVSPRNSILPPRTANASCQTDSYSPSNTRDAEVQTEEIKIDLRRFRAHLLPEADSFSGYDAAAPMSDNHRSYQSERSRDTVQSVSVQEMTETLEAKAIRDTVQRSLAQAPEFRESVQSQDLRDLQRRSSFWGGQSARSSSVLMSLHDEPGIKSGQSSILARELRKSGISEVSNPETYLAPALPDRSELILVEGPRPIPVLAPHTQSKDREFPPISNGMRPTYRSRASSVGTAGSSVGSSASQPPPLPIPQRSSSRVHTDLYEDSVEAISGQGSPRLQRHGSGSSSTRPRGLRKARSSNSIKRSPYSPPKARRRPTARLAALAPIQSMVFEDLDDIESVNEGHSHEEEDANPFGLPDQPPAVAEEELDKPLVDAIASAMVGEWMWKYPQKRKSFGIADSGKEFGAGEKPVAVRQRRWIWLSPYERTIMWSTKQPMTGSALLGKAARKLLIKTVLDVRDDNPLPKGSNYATCYERSIIILTPDRPLKLTASSRDRHYFWLMALSFLANPNQGPPRIPRLPSTSKGAPENNRPKQLEHKDSVIEQSIHKVGTGQFRNATAPPSLSGYNDGAGRRHPYSDGTRTALSGRSTTSYEQGHESATGRSSSRGFRWPGSVSSASASQSGLQGITSSSTINNIRSRGHTRQRSNTAPVSADQLNPSATSLALPPAILRDPSRQNTLTSRSESRQSATHSNVGGRERNMSRHEAGTIRMTAFVDPVYEDADGVAATDADAEHGASSASAVQAGHVLGDVDGSAVRSAGQDVFVDSTIDSSAGLIMNATPALQQQQQHFPTPPRQAGPGGSLRQGPSPPNVGRGSRSNSSSGANGSSSGLQGTYRIASPPLRSPPSVPHESGWGRPRAGSRAGGALRSNPVAAGGEVGSTAKGVMAGGPGGAVVGRTRGSLAQGREGALSSASGMAMDEKRRLGYIFDDEGRDPFGGF